MLTDSPSKAANAFPLIGFLLLSGCQLLAGDPTHVASAAPTEGERWQGLLDLRHDPPHLQPCGEGRRFRLVDRRHDLADKGRALLLHGQSPEQQALFVDLRARASNLPHTNNQLPTLELTHLYRLERGAQGCGNLLKDRDKDALLVQASGSQPHHWAVRISAKGLLFTQDKQPPMALPYLVEQLPEGRANYSTEANGKRLQLWIAPQACEDLNRGLITPLSATLQLNQTIWHGCAYYGQSFSQGRP